MRTIGTPDSLTAFAGDIRQKSHNPIHLVQEVLGGRGMQKGAVAAMSQ
jgi:hypothetical protein